MAPDAVIRFVERADEIGARIGEREAFAMAQVLESVRSEAAARVRMHGHEAHVIELLRCLEKHAGAVLRLAGGRARGPGGVARSELELVRVARFIREPCRHLARELELAELAAEQRGGGRLRIEAREIRRL